MLKVKRATRSSASVLRTDRRLYFAYGSNLNVRGMRDRCPDAKKLKAFRLAGCRLVFRGVADIEVTKDRKDWVEGGLWQITPRDEIHLDRYEGARSDPATSFYRKLSFTIRINDKTHDVLVYKMNERERGIVPPGEWYYNIIVRGYQDFGLDMAKLDEALARSWGEKDWTPTLTERHIRKGKQPLARAPELILPDDVGVSNDNLEQVEDGALATGLPLEPEAN